ncbi:MAG: ANTAR domain-containing protein [Lachnospiraceae bacterium]|nr:ANTAR domain-containing protein [Lachnospiraceae bacterium]
MPRNEDIQHSILIVSNSEKFNALIKSALPDGAYFLLDHRKSAATARQCIQERFYDIVIINSPLPDEIGYEFAMDVTDMCSATVMMVVPAQAYDDVTERIANGGIIAIAKPFREGNLRKTIRLVIALQNRIHVLKHEVEAAREKNEELRIVDKAKFMLMEERNMSEAEAHKYIIKQAMDSGSSKKRMAERIIDDLE